MKTIESKMEGEKLGKSSKSDRIDMFRALLTELVMILNFESSFKKRICISFSNVSLLSLPKLIIEKINDSC